MALDSILSTPVIPPPQKGGTSPSAGPSPGSAGGNGGDSSSSTTSTSSTSSSGSADAANNSGGNSGSGSPARGSGASKGASTSRSAKPNSRAQSAASSSTKARPSSANNPTQAAAAAGARNAATQNKNAGPSFIEALAQTQADAQNSADATAATAPQPVMGSKSKGTKNDDPDSTGASLGFLSQSLAAAMAGLQSTSPAQNLPANTTTDGNSTDTVSLGGGNADSTIESVVANIAQGTAEGLKAATTTADGKADSTPSSAAPVTDNTAAAAASAFHAHMVSPAQANMDALSHKVNAPVGTTGFPDEVGDKITWMANQGVQSASLQLTPEHLGPVEVRISMQDGSASVTFNAAHADTRAALEQTLPHLREMFSSQGLTLTDASVSQQSPRGQPQRQAVSAIGATRGASGADSTSAVASVTRIQLGLVDTYA